MVTLKDLYEGAKVKQESSSVMFTPLITKQLKRNFDAAYASYKESRGDVAEVEPEYVKEFVKQRLTQFFDELRAQVKACKESVTEKIRNSQSLQELEKLVEVNKDLFDEQVGEVFKQQKDKFDDKISKYRFAGIINRKQIYEDLMTKID